MERQTEYANGKLLRELREARRTTIEKAAVDIGISDKSLRLYETRDAAITWKNTEKLAAYYGMRPEELVIPAERRRPEAVAAQKAAEAAKRAREATEQARSQSPE